VYKYSVHQRIEQFLAKANFSAEKYKGFYARLTANSTAIYDLYFALYEDHPQREFAFETLLKTILQAYLNRSESCKAKDAAKAEKGHWFLSQEIVGMSLYADRFYGNLKNLADKLDYFQNLGVNLLHLMPLFQSPPDESDGGYAVSDFRKVDARFGTLKDLQKVRQKMDSADMYLMLDIVLNHTSHRHEWAEKAKKGAVKYQDYFYMYPNRKIPDEYDRTMPEIFPESAPGSFTYIPDCDKWVMTVFHEYQWDLNYRNPAVLVEMLDTIFFYANIGVDILRIDAPAFIWKQLGTTCQNLPEAHTLLCLIKQCVAVAAPGMALLGEAIVAPTEIMKYFGTESYQAQECDFAYNATHMALQWDALATGDTRIMLAAQPQLLQKPLGTSWITYTRCHDDIGLGYEDATIAQVGYNPYEHRRFLMSYYSGAYFNSPATGALFGVNPKTQDARISGTLASLCGLERAVRENNAPEIDLSIRKILLMQAHSFFLGGVPMLFYGDEVGYTNDYSFLEEEDKSYDNRWMHRPMIDRAKNQHAELVGTIENRIFEGTKRLIQIRKQIHAIADYKNLAWLYPHNRHVAGYVRTLGQQQFFGIFNFSPYRTVLAWQAVLEAQPLSLRLLEHWEGKYYGIGRAEEYLITEPYRFYLLEAVVAH
jgi:amylosucrase